MAWGGARVTRAVVLLTFIASVSRVAAQPVPGGNSAEEVAAPRSPLPAPESTKPPGPGDAAPPEAELPESPAPSAAQEPEAAPPEAAPPPTPPEAAPPPVPAPPAPELAPVLDQDPKQPSLRYLLEKVRVEGNRRTRTALIKRFVPIRTGASFDVHDPEIQALRYRLLGTGWYDRVELRLERGKRPGWVVLVIQVEERQTIVFQQLAAGVGWTVPGVKEEHGNSRGPGRKAEPYLGLSVADLNFLGSGRTLGGQMLVAPDQQGFELSYFEPWLRGSRWSLRAKTSFVNGREYFGGDRGVRVSVQCDPGELSESDLRDCEVRPPAAVVEYWRAGLGLGTARDVGSFTRLTLDWHGDFVRVPPGGMPVAASEVRGSGPSARAPIDFAIEPYSSFVSMLTLGLHYDKRDSAVLPTRGLLVTFNGDLASALIGSSYEFVRLQASVNRWSRLPWGHTVRVGAYAGAVYGYAPFFYKFFVSDLTDLMPSRILGLNLDHRPAPNLFGVFQCGRPFQAGCGTAIGQMRQEELAARFDVEYTWPFLRGRKKFVRNGDFFALIGIYALADPKDLRVSIPGYEGLARLPIDLTFDLGFRLDTRAGVFQVGLAKLLWLPWQ